MTDASFHKELTRGDVLDGAYRIVRLIAEGGMGHVYEAEQIRLDRRVALKVLSVDPRRSREFLPRFRREAEICAKLAHPHIIAVLDWNVSDGMPYLVMEYLEGEDLGIRLSRGPAALDEMLYVIDGIAQGLGAAHSHGVVHRDLKPSNVYLCEVGGARPHVKLLDFGVSKVSWEATLSTTSPKVLGSPRYMAPEQARGDPNVDHRVDQFALGTVAYEMLSGRFAFDGDSLTTVLYRVVHEPPPSLAKLVPDVPEHVIRSIERAMEKGAPNRFENITQFVDALHGRVPPDAAHKVADRTAAFGAIPLDAPAVLVPVAPKVAPKVAPVVARDTAPAEPPFSHGTQPITQLSPQVSSALANTERSKTATYAAAALAVVAVVAALAIWRMTPHTDPAPRTIETATIAPPPPPPPPSADPDANRTATNAQPTAPAADAQPTTPIANAQPVAPAATVKPVGAAGNERRNPKRAELPAAKKLIDDALALYNAGDYRTAIVRGKQALGYDNAPRAHRIIALSYCQLGSLGDVRAEMFDVASADKPAVVKVCAAHGIEL